MANKAFYLDKNIFHQKFINNFWSKVNKNRADGCWEWMGQKSIYGYGKTAIRVNKKTRFLTCHRVSYALENGSVPESLMVMHLCNARFCVNPSHLKLGTAADNLGYASSLKRTAIGERNGKYTKPESTPRGKDHWTNSNQEARTRNLVGENNPAAKVTTAQVLQIRQEYIPKVTKVKDLAAKYNVSFNIILNIVRRKTWKHI